MTTARIKLDGAEGGKCTTYLIEDLKSAQHTLPRGDSKDTWDYREKSHRTHLNTSLADEFKTLDRQGALLPTTFYSEYYEDADRLKLPRLCLSTISQKTTKPHLKDKLLWLCHELHATGASTAAGAPVNTLFYRNRIGMRGSRQRDGLVQMGLLEKCRNHSGGNFAARYRFTANVLADDRIAHYKLKTKRLIKKRSSKNDRAKAMVLAVGYTLKMISDLNHIEISPPFINQFEDYLRLATAQGKSTSSTQALLNFWREGRTRISIKDFRITTHICGTPATLRRLLLVNGKPAHELDLANSHPALLAAILRPTEDSDEAERMEHQKLVQLIQSGLFYEAFEHCWHGDRWKFVNFAAPKKDKSIEQIRYERAEFMCLPARKGIKLCWQLVINCQPTFYQTKIMKELHSCLPHFAKRLNALKNSRKGALGELLRKREAQMVNELAQRTDQPCATIYDGWLSNEQGVRDILMAAAEVTEKHLGFTHIPIIANSKA